MLPLKVEEKTIWVIQTPCDKPRSGLSAHSGKPFIIPHRLANQINLTTYEESVAEAAPHPNRQGAH
jgi:hypothetical protein